MAPKGFGTTNYLLPDQRDSSSFQVNFSMLKKQACGERRRKRVRQPMKDGKLRCKECLEFKPLSDFYEHRKDRPTKTRQPCKKCMGKRNRKKWPQSKETRDRNNLQQHGITVEQYQARLQDQGGRCAICPATKPGRGRGGEVRWHIDHDHTCCPGPHSCGVYPRSPLRQLQPRSWLLQG